MSTEDNSGKGMRGGRGVMKVTGMGKTQTVINHRNGICLSAELLTYEILRLRSE